MQCTRYFLLGFDPAQIRDYAALAAVEVTLDLQESQEFAFRLFALERRQKLAYPDLIKWAVSSMEIPIFNENVTQSPELILDAGGVGIAVKDLLIRAGVKPIAVTSTSGGSVTKEDNHNYHVGKAMLVGKFLTAFDSGRFQVNPNLPIYKEFERELLAFKAELSTRGNAIFEAEEGEHDDLLAACWLCTWYAEARPKPTPIIVVPQIPPEELVTPAWQNNWFGPTRPSPYRYMY